VTSPVVDLVGPGLTSLCADCAAVELAAGGPHGFKHGWVCVDPAKCGHRGVSGRAHTSRLVARDVRGQRARLKNASPSLAANRATAALKGKRGSDYQHLAAARLHAAAARSASSPELRAHHDRMAKMHRGIAVRTPGRMTGAPKRDSAGRQLGKNAQGETTRTMPDFSGRGKGPPEFEAGRRASQQGKGPFRTPRPLPWPGNKRTPRPLPSYSKPIGPNMGQLGKAAKGSNRNLSKANRATAYAAGHALPPPSKGAPHGFPVTSPKSWEDARRAVGRVKSPARRAQLKALLRRTAAQYGKTKALKASWAAANTLPGLELAVPASLAVTSPYDVMITRAQDGSSAVIRHRRGGAEIGTIKSTPEGWVAVAGGKDLAPHTRQRAALLELIGTHNRASGTPYHRPTEPLQPKPEQTELMRQYGIPAIRAMATPSAGADDGPRVTTNGLSPRGTAIYKKLRSRNFPHERAHAFARRAQNKIRGRGK